jgi:site-specific recombinase XerD
MQFVEYQRGKFDYHPNTVGNWIKYLKSFLNWCKENNYQTGNLKIKKVWVQPEKIYLTMADIQKLLIAPVSGRLEKIRDVFVFACFTGLRYSDFSKVVNENIIEKDGQMYLSFIPQKTNSVTTNKVKRVEIPLVPIVLQILRKYRDTGAYALPVMSNQKMNEYLKELG